MEEKMRTLSHIMAFCLLSLLALSTQSIQLINNTDEVFIYTFEQPRIIQQRSALLPISAKQTLKINARVTIPSKVNMVRFYDVEHPNRIKGQYVLSDDKLHVVIDKDHRGIYRVTQPSEQTAPAYPTSHATTERSGSIFSNGHALNRLQQEISGQLAKGKSTSSTARAQDTHSSQASTNQAPLSTKLTQSLKKGINWGKKRRPTNFRQLIKKITARSDMLVEASKSSHAPFVEDKPANTIVETTLSNQKALTAIAAQQNKQTGIKRFFTKRTILTTCGLVGTLALFTIARQIKNMPFMTSI